MTMKNAFHYFFLYSVIAHFLSLHSQFSFYKLFYPSHYSKIKILTYFVWLLCFPKNFFTVFYKDTYNKIQLYNKNILQIYRFIENGKKEKLVLHHREFQKYYSISRRTKKHDN